MDTRINRIIASYFSDMKDQLKKQILDLNFSDKEKINELLETIVEYPRLTLTKDDFVKRKRVKNSIPVVNRWVALRANGEQCTRRRKDDTTDFCGTHLKGTPHGVCDQEEETKPLGHKIEVWAQDIQGIVYYIDKTGNVYQMEDIMQSKVNPKIIAKYVKVGETYIIPEFNS